MRYEFSRRSWIELTVLVTTIAVSLILGAQTPSSGQRVVIATNSYSSPYHYVSWTEYRSKEIFAYPGNIIFWYPKNMPGPSPNKGSFGDMKADATQEARANAGANAGRACREEFQTRGLDTTPTFQKHVFASGEVEDDLVKQVTVVDYSIDAVVCHEPSDEEFWKNFDIGGGPIGEHRPRAPHRPGDLICYAAVRVTCEFPAATSQERPQAGKVSELAGMSSDDVRQQIQAIRRGPHAAVPPAQASASGAARETSLTFENATDYPLFVFLSGPTTQKVQIAARQSQTLRLDAGNYEIAAEITAPMVKPYYGQQVFEHGTQYSERFFLTAP